MTENYKFIVVYDKDNLSEEEFSYYTEDEETSSDDVHERVMDDLSSEPYTLYKVKESQYLELLKKISAVSKVEIV